MRRSLLLPILLALAGCDARPPAVPPIVVVEPRPIERVDAEGLHNVFRVSERIYSGSSPEGDAGFATLARLGVKMLLSVDGARPDVATARRHGLTYVHLPFGYDGIPPDRVKELAKAAGRPGPIYVHCHHGKHRGPAAVAVIQLCTDPAWDAAVAEGWLATAGTDPRYTGLTGLPRTLARPTAEELAALPAALPEAAPVPDLARIMVDVDARWDHLKLIKAAGWVAPEDHPDIDPPHEALQLLEHYRETIRLGSAKDRGADFLKLVADAEAAAADLEQALRAKPVAADRAGPAFARSAAACTACHERFRDKPARGGR